MFPDEPWAEPVTSFRGPVPPPVGDADAAPVLTVSIACAWLPVIRGALQQLLMQATWDTGNPALLLLTQQRAMTLISLLHECSSAPAFSCPYNFTLSGAGTNGWVNTPEGGYWVPGNLGQFDTGGLGWISNVNYHPSGTQYVVAIEVQKNFLTPITVNAAQAVYNLTKGTFGIGGLSNRLRLVHGGVLQAQATSVSSTTPDGINQLNLTGGPWTVDEIDVWLYAGYQFGSDPLGSVELIEVNYNLPGGGCS